MDTKSGESELWASEWLESHLHKSAAVVTAGRYFCTASSTPSVFELPFQKQRHDGRCSYLLGPCMLIPSGLTNSRGPAANPHPQGCTYPTLVSLQLQLRKYRCVTGPAIGACCDMQSELRLRIRSPNPFELSSSSSLHITYTGIIITIVILCFSA